MKEFYNTTNESGTQLEMFTQKAMKQEDKVMLIFKTYYMITAYECWEYFNDTKTPITSIRRAITNLTRKDKLVMTAGKKEGGYGRANYIYKLR